MLNKPKIILCGPSRNSVSGVATHLNQLFSSSLADKYELVQFQVGSEGRNEGKLHKFIRLLTTPINFLGTIIKERPDIVHLNTSLEPKAYWRDLVYLFASRLFNIKIVYQVHGGELPHKFLGETSLGQDFLRWTLGLSTAIVLLAEIENQSYVEFGITIPIKIIPNAIDLNCYASIKPKAYSENSIVIGYIGRLASDKGIKEAVEALAMLREEGIDNIKLMIAGSGPYEKELKRIISVESCMDSVEFTGPIFGVDKLRFWNDIDIFVFPTFHREGLPYTILESLASGTPMITTPVAGIADAIVDGVHGYFVEPHNAAAVAEKIKYLSINRDKLRSMSEASMQRANEFYGIDRLSMQFDQLYQEILH